MTVDHRLLMLKVCKLSRDFQAKTEWSCIQSICCFSQSTTWSFGVLHGNHSDPLMRSTTQAFIQSLLVTTNTSLLTWIRHQCSLACTQKEHWIKKEKKTIHSQKSTDDTEHISWLVTVMASGRLLPSLQVYKGVEETRKLSCIKTGLKHFYQGTSMLHIQQHGAMSML